MRTAYNYIFYRLPHLTAFGQPLYIDYLMWRQNLRLERNMMGSSKNDQPGYFSAFCRALRTWSQNPLADFNLFCPTKHHEEGFSAAVQDGHQMPQFFVGEDDVDGDAGLQERDDIMGLHNEPNLLGQQDGVFLFAKDYSATSGPDCSPPLTAAAEEDMIWEPEPSANDIPSDDEDAGMLGGEYEDGEYFGEEDYSGCDEEDGSDDQQFGPPSLADDADPYSDPKPGASWM